MTVPAWADRHIRAVLFVLLVLGIAGALAAWALPAALFPRVNFPRIRVNFDCGDRPAERMELEVTRPAELALRGVPNVRSVESTTSRGSAEVSVVFDWGQDMNTAGLQLGTQINQLLAQLPRETTYTVRRMDPTVFPVIAYSMTSATRPLWQLRDMATQQLIPELSKVTGVARAELDGAATAEIQVIIHPDQLAARSLAVTDISTALANANVLSAVGHLTQDDRLYLVISDSRVTDLEQIRQLPVLQATGAVVRVRDVADVCLTEAPRYTRSVADGSPCAMINVYQQPEGNTVRIASDIRETIDRLRARLPGDVAIKSWYDQSDLITSSASAVRDAVIIGMGLAALVLLVFLRDWRITLIATIAVPIVLIITVLVLYALGQSFNIMTLGGMAAAVGLIIDDAIVMSEHISRRLHADNQNATAARVIAATNEFSIPLAGSSLSTIVIHIPPAFLIGVFGAFFAALSLSMAVSLIISFFVAWLVIPVLAGRLLGQHRREPGPSMIGQKIIAGYLRVMRQALKLPLLSILIVVALLTAGYAAFNRMESGVIPSIDEGGFVIDYHGPPSASLAEMDQLLARAERVLAETPEVQTYSRRTGFSLGGDISESNNGDFFVRLKPMPRRSLDAVMKEISGKIRGTVAGLDIDPAKLMEDLLGDLTGKPQPVVVNLFGDDETNLISLAGRVSDAMGKVSGLSAIESGVLPAGDAVQITVDPLKAAVEGMTAAGITQSVQDLLDGSIATQVQRGQKTVAVRVAAIGQNRWETDDLLRLNLRAPDGHLVPLKRVAEISMDSGQPEINRLDLKRVVSITARSSRDLGSTIRDVQSVLQKPGLIPASVNFTLGGQYQEQQEAFRGTARVVIAAAALVFLLLLLLYRSLRVAIAILLTSATAIAAVFVALRITGTELNISSMMGLVMIVGNVTEVAIFFYSEYQAMDRLEERSNDDQRLCEAGALRLRAIFMTTAAAILALLPLALNLGGGAGMLRPLAIAIIAGLAVQLPLVLVLLPLLLSLFFNHRRQAKTRSGSI